jgi:hypothetical protein
VICAGTKHRPAGAEPPRGNLQRQHPCHVFLPPKAQGTSAFHVGTRIMLLLSAHSSPYTPYTLEERGIRPQ